MKLNPTENATYYIWEVPNTYLTPETTTSGVTCRKTMARRPWSACIR